MNAQLREVAINSQLVYPDGTELLASWTETIDLSEYLEKFAELIVQECAAVLTNEMHRLDSIQGRELAAQTMETAAWLVKTHFGFQ